MRHSNEDWLEPGGHWFAGTFGRVLECWDRDAREYVAIKVIRSVQKYRDAAMIEIDVLHTLAKNDRTGSWLVLYLERCYYCHLIELCCKEWPALLVHIYFFLRLFIKICRKPDSSLHWMIFEDPWFPFYALDPAIQISSPSCPHSYYHMTQLVTLDGVGMQALSHVEGLVWLLQPCLHCMASIPLCFLSSTWCWFECLGFWELELSFFVFSCVLQVFPI